MSAERTAPARLLEIHDRFTQAEFVVACVALVIVLGSYLFEVVSRYGFGTPTRWSSDLVQYMLCVSMALALPEVTREGGHVAITSFLEKLRVAAQAHVVRAIAWLGVLGVGVTALLFVQVAINQASQGIETVAAFAIPKWWLTGVVALGLLDSALHLLRQALGWSPARVGESLEP